MQRPLRELLKSLFVAATCGLSDAAVIQIDHLRAFHRTAALEAPRRFTDKLQHHKLNVRDPRMPALADKIAVKDHVAAMLGEDWVTPTLWSGTHATETLLRSVGHSGVIKPNHASGLIAFFDRESDLAKIAQRANTWRRHDYHLLHREWVYAEIERKLLIEPVIAPPEEIKDYKFWVIDGKVALIQVDRDRFTRHLRQFYDPDWRLMPLRMNYPASRTTLPRPAPLDAMLEAAVTLAQDFRFARIDLYVCAGRPRFGEITFWPEAGLGQFRPDNFDEALGARWSYPAPPRVIAGQRVPYPTAGEAMLTRCS